MKGLLIAALLLSLSLPFRGNAQNDSIRLSCPLLEATVIPPPLNKIHYDPPDLCIVLASIPDTIVKACIDGKVTNVEPSDEGDWEVVLFVKYNKKDYYFWYSGLSSVSVKRNDVVKTGQAIGAMLSGGSIELLMYDFETQVDPTPYLDCKRILKN
jgi:hypothetical protein